MCIGIGACWEDLGIEFLGLVVQPGQNHSSPKMVLPDSMGWWFNLHPFMVFVDVHRLPSVFIDFK